MKKASILFLITSMLFTSTIISSFASSAINLTLDYDHTKSYEKLGRQYHNSALEAHGDKLYLTLYGNSKDLLNVNDIRQGTPVLINPAHEKKLHLVDHVHHENGDMLICIEMGTSTQMPRDADLDLTLEFYTKDLSQKLYIANIKNVPMTDDPAIPQTGDGAMFFVLAGAASLIIMAFLLAPKKSSSYR